MSANQRPWQPSWISNQSEKVQHMFKTLIVTFMASLVPGNVVVLKKKSKIRNVLHYRQTNLHQTLFDQKSSL
jgi:hypothetical protein